MKLAAVDISKTSSASTIIFEALRRAIIEGAIPEGEPLRQNEIAAMFNTSRIPVREAIHRLVEHGLVRTQRFKGAVVARLSREEAAEIFEFRAHMESEIIRRAVPRMTAESLAEARMHCEAFGATRDPMQWADLNQNFHSTLCRASGLDFHMEVIDNAMDRVGRYVRAQLLLADGIELAHVEHTAILEACERGEAEHAAELTRRHIEDAKESLLAYLEERPRLEVASK